MKTFSILVNGQCWHSGLSEDDAHSLAAEYRLEEEKNVRVVPDDMLVG